MGVFTVQISGRFIRQNHAGGIHERSSNGNPLLFSPRELWWAVFRSVIEANFTQQLKYLRPNLGKLHSLDERWHCNIFERGELR